MQINLNLSKLKTRHNIRLKTVILSLHLCINKMRKILKKVIMIACLTSLCAFSYAQDSLKSKWSFGLDFNPTQYDKKSEYWADAKHRAIAESGTSFSANALVKIDDNVFLKCSFTKHRDTEETTRNDNQNSLIDLVDILVFVSTWNYTFRDRIDYRQIVNNSSYTLAVGGIVERQTCKKSFVGLEYAIGMRAYTREIKSTVSLNGKVTEQKNETRKEKVPNFKVQLTLRDMITNKTSIVGKIGVANTPLSIGIQYNL